MKHQVDFINRQDIFEESEHTRLKFERISSTFTEIFADQFEDKIAARLAWEDGGGIVLMRIFDIIYPEIEMEQFHSRAIKIINEAKVKDPDLSMRSLSFIALEGLLEPENKTYNVMYQRQTIDSEIIISPLWEINPETNEQKMDTTPLLNKILDKNILYLKIPLFNNKIHIGLLEKEFDISIQKHDGPIIIDVRNNKGGLLERIVNISSYFVPYGETIYKIKTVNGQQDIYRATNNNMESTKTTIIRPTLVLINENTDAGALMFAAALQEKGIAKVAGNLIATVNDKIRTVVPLRECPSGRYSCMAAISTGVIYLGSDRPLSDGLTPDFPNDWNTENAFEKIISAWLE